MTKPAGIGPGDRVLCLGIGQLRGKHGDVLSARPPVASVRFDTGISTLVLAADLHPIPRRPPPDF